MASSTLPPSQRWFDDFTVDEVFEFGNRLVTEDEIVEFARRYDPQPFHIDPKAAAQSHFGGLVASGWMSGALLMREMYDHFICAASSMGSPGLDELRWLQPVRPGDRLSVRVTVLATKRSTSKPERGFVTLRQELLNQDGTVVMRVQGVAMLRCRPA